MRQLPRLAPLLLALASACGKPTPTQSPAAGVDDPGQDGEASGPASSWRYTIALDEDLTALTLGLCITGPRPRRLVAGPEALALVVDARVRGGPELTRAGEALGVSTLGEHGCLDLRIDLRAAVADGRFDGVVGAETMMFSPKRWLWHPAEVPDGVDAQARFELPAGMAATVPWSPIGDEPDGYQLPASAFRWDAWIGFGRYQPLRFVAADCPFEVAVLGDPAQRRADDDDIQRWISVAAETSATLYGRFPRERVAVVVVPTPGWGGDPVLFGMARRGGGASAMLLLDSNVDGEVLVGEWVAVHEFLHFTMPLIGDPWMSEGFVTYYTQVLRARRGVLGHGALRQGMESAHEQQIRLALQGLATGFAKNRSGTGSLADASANMRRTAAYRRVYWGGAAMAFDLDLQLRAASRGARSLDDLMLALEALVVLDRRWTAAALFERFDQVTAQWFAAGELSVEISPSAIMQEHLEARAIPPRLRTLEGLAVDASNGDVRLLANPRDDAQIRNAMFNPRPATSKGR